MEITIERGEKVYKGVFKKPSIDIYATFFDYLITEPFMAEISLAKGCFIEGNEELIDFENNIDLFYEYKDKLIELLEIKPVRIIQKPPKNIDFDYTLGIRLKDGDKTYSAYFKKPGFNIVRKTMALYDKDLLFEAAKHLARSTFISGDNEMIDFKEHPEYFASYKQYMLNTVSSSVNDLKKKS